MGMYAWKRLRAQQAAAASAAVASSAVEEDVVEQAKKRGRPRKVEAVEAEEPGNLGQQVADE